MSSTGLDDRANFPLILHSFMINVKSMKILAIETSCDETAVAVLEIKNNKFKILANLVSSQVKLHAKYGGIYPSLAKREHQKNLPILLSKALKKNKGQKINLVAVTVGPGLEPCLWVGINFAKELAKKIESPLVPVNHIEAHILTNFISSNFQKIFPAICLVVSGGHTQLILMKGIKKYKILGETRDDAAGECFDKTARILGLGYPGGPDIAKEAAKFKENPRGKNYAIAEFLPRLPRPMINQKNYDFSFSGLKTAVLYDFKSRSPKTKKSKKYIRGMAAEIQQAVIDVLIKKTLKAAKGYKAKSIILGGGVAANDELRKQFKEKIKEELPNTKYILPDTKYCTDNAVMTAIAGYYHQREARKKKNLEDIEAEANQRIEAHK